MKIYSIKKQSTWFLTSHLNPDHPILFDVNESDHPYII